jgi:hypothetical protein
LARHLLLPKPDEPGALGFALAQLGFMALLAAVGAFHGGMDSFGVVFPAVIQSPPFLPLLDPSLFPLFFNEEAAMIISYLVGLLVPLFNSAEAVCDFF